MLLAGVFISVIPSIAQQGVKEELLKYGDMDHWVIRNIHESAII